MLPPLIAHSPDLKRLWDAGMEIELKGGFLLAHHIPYVNAQMEIKYGTLVTNLNLVSPEQTGSVNDHVIHFIGDHPCDRNGVILSPIQHSSGVRDLGSGIIIQHSFSNKPAGGYTDYFSKVSRYAEIISAPAKALNGTVTEFTFMVREPADNESVFNYLDTNSSRAEINATSEKLMGQRIGIVGLGGTGSYILDFIAKCPVAEIHLFDADWFLQHNAFRAPGAPSVEDLNYRWRKVDYLKAIYSKMHRYIIPHPYDIDASTVNKLESMDFVFLCQDKDDRAHIIVEYLVSKNKTFIDVGLGLEEIDGRLIGIARITTSEDKMRDHVRNSGRIPFVADKHNAYLKNIQIAELNSLNASFAVIKWKKLSGFYQDLEKEYFSTYTLNTNQLLSEDNLS